MSKSPLSRIKHKANMPNLPGKKKQKLEPKVVRFANGTKMVFLKPKNG